MALSFSSMPPASSFFAAYASVSAFIMLLQTIINQLIPLQLKHYVLQHLRLFFTPRRNHATIIVEERDGMSSNEIYYATETYLCAKIRPNIERLKICKHHKDSGVLVRFAQCEKILDFFEEIELEWRFVNEEKKKTSKVIDESTDSVIVESEKRYFELRFDGKYKDKILDFYVPFVLQSAKMINSEKKVVKLHTLACASSYGSSIMWDSINLLHPSTFETLAIEPSLKKGIIEDLDRFVRRKEFYRKVGRAWKRGYLLYGPPGTGKSSLIAAIANYLKFDIYDLELTNIKRDSDLRRLLLRTANRSILVIEDIDCTVELPDRKGLPSTGSPNGYWQSQRPRDQFTLSGLLNFIDGLWSSCGDERIIIFTTNNKDKLDPALLRPGRMDMHIHMSYLTPDGFKLLASTYLNVHHEHPRLSEIEDLIKTIKITPAEVAEELMKSDDVDTILDGLVDFLKNKNNNNNDNNKEDAMDDKKTDDANEEEEDEKVNQCKAADESMINLCAKCAKQI